MKNVNYFFSLFFFAFCIQKIMWFSFNPQMGSAEVDDLLLIRAFQFLNATNNNKNNNN